MDGGMDGGRGKEAAMGGWRDEGMDGGRGKEDAMERLRDKGMEEREGRSKRWMDGFFHSKGGRPRKKKG